MTFTPDSGLLPASFTVTASAFANAVLMVADCGVVPAFAVIKVATPTLTAIVPEVPLMELVTVSVPVMVCEPTVISVAENVPTPEVNVEFGGRTAAESVELKCTVPT